MTTQFDKAVFTAIKNNIDLSNQDECREACEVLMSHLERMTTALAAHSPPKLRHEVAEAVLANVRRMMVEEPIPELRSKIQWNH